jgi:hypothetical protein
MRLKDGREIRFPAAVNRRLRGATAEQLSNIEIICNGTGLHWPDLDEDLSVIGILEGRLGQLGQADGWQWAAQITNARY